MRQQWEGSRIPDDIRAIVRRFDKANLAAAKAILDAPAIFHPESAGAGWARAVLAKPDSPKGEAVE